MRPVILTFGIIFILFAIFFILFTAKEGTLKGIITNLISGLKQTKQNTYSSNISNGATIIPVPSSTTSKISAPKTNSINSTTNGSIVQSNSTNTSLQIPNQNSTIYNIVSSNESQFVPPFDPNQVDNQKLALNSCSTDAQCMVNQRCDLRIRICQIKSGTN
ncbi:MAG: hypothetical protein AABX38_02865 [Candidatus Micrarchaeota archaeon]